MYNYIHLLQVCEEDIVRALADTPCQSEVMSIETSDDHPLRVLSEENLTCASTFTGKGLSLVYRIDIYIC